MNKTAKIFIFTAALAVLASAVIFASKKNAGRSISSSQPASRVQQPSPLGDQKHQIRHVFILIEENARFESVVGNTEDMPFLNSLAQSFAYSKNYFANRHPSIAGYFLLTTGKAISSDNDFTDTVDENNLARIFAASGKTWKEYSESLPSAGYAGGDEGPYRRHHNPFSYFSDVRSSDELRQNLVPLDQLAKDVAENNLPDFAMIVPDNRHNLHDCETGIICTGSQKRKAADKWLKDNIAPLLRSPAFSQPGGGLLIITADEGSKADRSHGGGHTFWIAAGPDVKNGYVSDTFFQHENTLRFMLELLGANDFPGKSATAAGMAEFLKEE